MLTQSVTVQNSGNVSLPLLGSFRVDGLTAAELEAAIVSKLVALDLVTAPEVLIYVTEYSAKRIYILGEVDAPGEFTMTQAWTLMDAILISGGLDDTAGRYGYLHRRIEERVVTNVLMEAPYKSPKGADTEPMRLPAPVSTSPPLRLRCRQERHKSGFGASQARRRT